MLIGRGPVYKSEGSGSFRSHDHCHCKAVPVFGSDTGWTEQSADLARLWKSSDGSLRDFRRIYTGAQEGRPVTPRRVKSVGEVTAAIPIERRLATLAALERSLAKFDSPATRRRIDELRAEIADAA